MHENKQLQPENLVRGLSRAAIGTLLFVISTLAGAITVQYQVQSTNDDAEEQNPPNGSMQRNSTDLELVYDGGTHQVVGMRFQGVAVPQGATINSAYLELETDETDSGTTNVVIVGQDSDDAAEFSSASGDISLRPQTSAQVAWSIPPWTSVNEKHQSPDITAIIQEIVNRSTWSSGNNLAILIEAGSGCGSSACQRTAKSYDGESANAPKLVIDFGAASAPTAYYAMDEGSWSGATGEVTDSSGNGYSATAQNGAATANANPAIAGDPGTCRYAELDGTNDYVELPATFPDLQSSFTITAWINADAVNDDQRILADDEHNSGGFGFSLGDGGDGKLRFFSRSVNPIIVDTQNVVINTGTWYFVAAVHDVTAKTRQIFVNGTAVTLNTGGTSSVYTGTWGTDSGLASIGGETNGAGSEAVPRWRFDGRIDEVRVYTSALTATQITQLMNETHACATAASKRYVVSATNPATLGGLSFENEDLVDYDPDTNSATMHLDGSGVFSNNEDIDAGHVRDNGHTVLSTTGNAQIGALSFGDEDLVDYDPVSGTATLLFDGSAVFSGNEDIDAVYVHDDGRIVLSTKDDASIGGLSFADEDLVEYDPVSGTATLLFDGSSVFAGGADVDAAHILADGRIVLSTTGNATIGSLSFGDEDLVEYDPVAGTATLVFDGSALFSGNEDIDAVHVVEVAATATLDHFSIGLGGASASTCVSQAITITAEDASNATITGYTGTVGLSTSSNHGDWSKLDGGGSPSADPAQGSLGNGTADDGAASYAFVSGDDGTIAIFLANSHADDLTITVSDASAAVSTTSVSLSFRDNAFVVQDNDSLSPTNAPVAGRDHALQVAMWRKDPSTGNCAVAGGYAGAKVLKGWLTRDGADPGGAGPSIGGSGPLPNGVPGANNVSATFSAGVANIALTTTDVGKYALNLRDDSRSFATGADIDGASPTLTVRPFGLGFSAIQAGATVNPSANTPTGGILTTAGSGFSATVGAYLWQSVDDTSPADGAPDSGVDITDNGLTPSFAWATTVSAALDEPSAGTVGTLNNGSIAQGSFSGGTATANTLQYLEVGSITLTALATDYLNTAGIGPSGSSGVVGRFSAHSFDFVETTSPVLSPACGSFSYVDQGFGYSPAPVITVRAMANGGVSPLQNYHDFGGGSNWWRLDLANGVTPAYTHVGAAPGGDISLDSAATGYTPTSGSGSNGVVTLSLNGSFTYEDRANGGVTPVAPFDAAIRLDLTVAEPPDYGDSATGTHTINPIAFPSPEQRWGRVAVDNAHGSELLALTVPMRAEYYDGTAFVTNAADNCTAVAEAHLALSSDHETGERDGNILVGPPAGPTATTTASVGNNPLSSGDAALGFSAPGAGRAGYVDIQPDLSLATGADLEHLRFDWDGSGNQDDPTGRATFGIYGGSPYVIHIREPFF